MASLEPGDERLEIGAGVQGGVFIQHPGALGDEVGPHAGGGGFDYGRVDGVIADFDHGLLQGRIHCCIRGVVFGVHATPPM